jgi:hypothetical protein
MSNESIIKHMEQEILAREEELRTLRMALAVLMKKPVSPSVISVVDAPTHGNGQQLKYGQRIEQLKEFLRAHGPSRRSEVLNGSKIPSGTADQLIADHPETFTRDGEGRWMLKAG